MRELGIARPVQQLRRGPARDAVPCDLEQQHLAQPVVLRSQAVDELTRQRDVVLARGLPTLAAQHPCLLAIADEADLREPGESGTTC